MTGDVSLDERPGKDASADEAAEFDAAPVEAVGDAGDADTAPGDTDTASGGDDEEIGILEVRGLVADIARTLLDQPFDGITAVEPTDDGWHVLFEVVERSAVPDTQDVIGRYELRLSATGDVEEYSLQQRFKRSELQGETL